jgi:hypothetical protein
VPEVVGRSLLLSAAWTGAVTAVLGAALGISICVISWLPDAGVSGHPMSAIRAGVFAFLAGQHGGVRLDGTAVAFTPLVITVLIGLLAWRASAALGEAAERLGRTSAGQLGTAWLVQTGAYTVACVVLSGFGRLGSTRVETIPVAIGAAVLFGLSAGAGLCRTGGLRERAAAVSPVLVDGARAALGAAIVYVGAGALLVASSLVVHGSGVMRLSRLVGGGLAGEPIALLGVATAPNAAIAGAAYLAGPGFTVGSGTNVSAFTSSHGVLPAFPVLAAVPAGRGPHVVLLVAMALTALLAGCVVARACAVGGLLAALRRLGVAVLGTGIMLAVLGWLGGGGIGDGRLHVVGASPWRLGAAVAVEVGAVALVVVLLWSVCRLFLGRGADEAEMTQERAQPVLVGSD